MNFADALGYLVRKAVRLTLGMPDNSIHAANDARPAGGQGDDFGTVLLLNMAGQGWPNLVITPAAAGTVTYTLEFLKEFVVSVQFFRSPAGAALVDVEGIPVQSDGAFDRAVRLPDLLQLPPNLMRLNQYGLGFIRVQGQPRNLTGLVDSLWESRGQVDLVFHVVNAEAATVAILSAAALQLQVATAGGYTDTRTIGVRT